jgi:hypothetical protein
MITSPATGGPYLSIKTGRRLLPQRKTASCEDFQLAKNDDLHLAAGRDFPLAIDNAYIKTAITG